jgi:hypothetical protein
MHEKSLHPYTTITDVGQKDLDIYNDTLRAIDSRCFKTANDDLGFTQNNFWQNASFKIQPMLIYIII